MVSYHPGSAELISWFPFKSQFHDFEEKSKKKLDSHLNIIVDGESNFEDKYVDKCSTSVQQVFNWSEFHLSEMTFRKFILYEPNQNLMTAS